MNYLERFAESVSLELKELQKLGIKVSASAINAANYPKLMAEYQDMKASECADLIRDLYPPEKQDAGQKTDVA